MTTGTLPSVNTEREGLSEAVKLARARSQLPPAAERRALRMASGLSCELAGRAVGVSRQAIHKWENGTDPGSEHLIAYLTFLTRLRAIQAGGRRRITPELLRQVADVVRANPDTPNLAVKKQLHTSQRNATRWITSARKEGYLTEEGQ